MARRVDGRVVGLFDESGRTHRSPRPGEYLNSVAMGNNVRDQNANRDDSTELHGMESMGWSSLIDLYHKYYSL